MQKIFEMTKGELLTWAVKQGDAFKAWVESNPLPAFGLGVLGGVVLTLYFRLVFSIFIVGLLFFGLLYIFARNEEL